MQEESSPDTEPEPSTDLEPFVAQESRPAEEHTLAWLSQVLCMCRQSASTALGQSLAMKWRPLQPRTPHLRKSIYWLGSQKSRVLLQAASLPSTEPEPLTEPELSTAHEAAPAEPEQAGPSPAVPGKRKVASKPSTADPHRQRPPDKVCS